MKTVLEVVNLGTEFLASKGIKNPKREVLDLFSRSLGLRPLDLYLQFDRPLQESELDCFRSHLKRRSKGEPNQYICGEVEFFDCTISLTRDVLIPRQETENLVDQIAQGLAGESLTGKVLWDICCGSGCIGIALKKRFPELRVVLSDISGDVLAVAKSNAERNNVELSLRQGDLWEPFIGEQAHFIVCNPPYVSEKEYLELDIEVRGFEPKLALVADQEGLAFYQRLAKNLKEHLHPKGRCWLELGHRQGAAVNAIFSCVPHAQLRLWQDWSGNDRFFFLEIE